MSDATVEFGDLGLPVEILEVLAAQRIRAPFDIQAATIPDVLAGHDVLGRAPTGSGKTLAFGLPILALLDRAVPGRPRGLVLSPTRELAEQIRRELEPFAVALDRRLLAIYGGVASGPQLSALRRGVDLVVATPGRLLDLIEQGGLSLDRVDRVVVDEADRMADMGFLPDVREILDLTSTSRQTLLFSATLDDDVEVLVRDHQDDPVLHATGELEPDLSQVSHRVIRTSAATKLALAADLIVEAGPTVVFCRTRHGVDRVARQLKQAGVKAGWIHGGRSQRQRDAALHAFTSGRVSALVATDVAARGIHVDGVACVLHFDPPADAKDYVHRSGRTARAGAEGAVVSFVNRDQERAVRRLLADAGIGEVDFEAAPTPSARADDVEITVRPRRRDKPSNDRKDPTPTPEPDPEATPKQPTSRAKTRPKPKPKPRPRQKQKRTGPGPKSASKRSGKPRPPKRKRSGGNRPPRGRR